jgi:colanic acid/amylovoran biosynthesis glycosyltransferase
MNHNSSIVGADLPAGRPFSVLHFRKNWLALTENWIFRQVTRLPEHVTCSVACWKLLNTDKFNVPRLHQKQGRDYLRHLAVALRYGYVTRARAHLACAIHQSGAALVHSHFGPDGWFAAPVARRLGARHVVTFYGVDGSQLPRQNPVWQARYRELFATVDRVLCEGPHFARTLAALGCPENKLTVQHLGVDVAAIKFAPRAWQPGEPLRVLLAGSFREKKGLPYALDALGRFQHEQALEITVIGDAGKEARSLTEKARILEMIQRHALGSKVRLLGYQPHQVMFDEAYRHHVFLSPSVAAADGDTEGGAPVSIIEMAATGMPVISTRHCDIPNVIPDGRCGLLAAERDVDGLVGHLRWLCRQPQAWEGLAKAARGRIEAEFNAKTQGTRLAALYAEVINGRTGSDRGRNQLTEVVGAGRKN